MTRAMATSASLLGYVALQPFYLGSSGGLQWCDAALPILAAALWWPRRIIPATPPPTISLIRGTGFLLTVWAAIVNGLWFAVYGTSDFLFASAALGHGFLVLCLVTDAWLQLGPRMTMRLLGLGGVAGLALSTVALPFSNPTPTGRATALFNNPNQLGYFTLCASGLVCLARQQRAIGWQWHILALCLAGVLIALSLSKAAMAGFACLLLIELWRAPRIATACGAVALAVLLLAANPGQEAMRRVSRSNADDSLEARGYPRLWSHPEHLLLGAGEGRYERFPTAFGKHREMHSTFGNLVMSYGLVGAVLASLLVLAAVRGAPVLGLAALLPLALYGLTHNGLRARGAWLLLAMVACVGTELARRREPGA